MLQTNYHYKYNPNEMSQEDFLARFVARKEIYQEIFEALKEADYDVPNQHHILIGQRGQGKTTLLRKLNISVKEDKKLSKFLLPVQFSEEQYNLRGLCRLWEMVAEYLDDFYSDIFENALEKVEEHEDDDSYHKRCFYYLETQLKSKKKKLLILIDNIDVFLGSLSKGEQHQLREILLTSSSFVIVGGSTQMFEEQYDYAKPFYEFFNTIPIEGLTFDESIALLRTLGNEEQRKKVEMIIEYEPSRIETLRIVTGGVPRTMVMLFDIFVEDNGDTFNDLLRVLDDVTPLYQDRMKHLSAVLQEITHTLALNWDGMLTKDIAKKVKMESKAVSAQLKQLEKYQVITSISVGKNKIYSIKERFFNIWYLMRYGKKRDRNKVEWLIRFLLSWYDRDGLKQKATKLRDMLSSNNNLNEHYIYFMAEALSFSGCLDIDEEYKLKKFSKEYLKNQGSSLYKDISHSDIEILKQAFELQEEGDSSKAINLLVKSKKRSKEIIYTLAIFYKEQKEYKKAQEYYVEAIDAGEVNALINLAFLYEEQKDYVKAEEYYLKAIDKGIKDAFFHLGNLYIGQKDFLKAEEYWLKAAEEGEIDACFNLALFYSKQKEYQKAEQYYLKVIDAGEVDALFALGNLYFEQENYIKAEEYWLQAIDVGDTDAMFNLGFLYKKQKEYQKAEKYLLQSINVGITDAFLNLGNLYFEQENYIKAEEFWLKSIDAGEIDAFLNLGLLYKNKKEYQKAKEYYLKAIDVGDKKALSNLAFLYEEQKEYQKAEELWLQAIDAGDNGAQNNLAWLYFITAQKSDVALELAIQSYAKERSYAETHTLAVILLWHEEFTKSYEMFFEWLTHDKAQDDVDNITIYVSILIAKGQFYKAKELLELPEYNLKERYKPIWYALMSLMHDEFPYEIKKMGSELQQTVEEVLIKIDEMRQKYSI